MSARDLPPRGDDRQSRIGLLGGSFNPAHAGHRHVSLVALERLELDEVWWLVSPQNPLKLAADMAPLGQRLARARQAAEHPRIRITGIERQLGTRYTVDTLRELRRRFPRARFVWLMGADNLGQIVKWRRWQEIFHRVPVAIFARPKYPLNPLANPAARRMAAKRVPERLTASLAGCQPPAWIYVCGPQHPESATRLRENEARDGQAEGGGPSRPEGRRRR